MRMRKNIRKVITLKFDNPWVGMSDFEGPP